jgi:hypothetical protein
MSLEELVAEAGRALSDARKLFGAAPLDGGLPLAQELVTARQGLADAAGSAAASWEGAGAASYRSANSDQLRALDRTIVGDGQLASALTSTGQTAAAGARSMDNLIAETRSGVAALGSSARSPAGQQELATYLQGQLSKAKGLVQTFQQRSSELAETIRSASASYGSLAGHSKDAPAVPLDSDTWKPGDKRHTPYNAGRGGMGPPNYPDAPPWVDIWDRSGGDPDKVPHYFVRSDEIPHYKVGYPPGGPGPPNVVDEHGNPDPWIELGPNTGVYAPRSDFPGAKFYPPGSAELPPYGWEEWLPGSGIFVWHGDLIPEPYKPYGPLGPPTTPQGVH